MALPKEVAELTEVDEKFRPLYEKGDDGIYRVPEIEGMVDKGKLDEFRENNRQMFSQKKKLEERLAGFENVPDDFDVETYQAAMEALGEARKNKDKELLDAGKVEEVIEERTKSMKATYEKQINQISKALDTEKKGREDLRGKYHKLLVTTSVYDQLEKLEAAIKPKGRGDIERRALEDWSINEENELAPKEGLFGKEGQPITLSEWAENLIDDADHCFVGASGAGAGGGEKKPSTGTKGGKLYNPTALEMGKHAKEIAEGTIEVVRTH